MSRAGLPLPWVSSLSKVVRRPSSTTEPQSSHTHCLWEYRSSSTTLDEPHSGQVLGIPAWEVSSIVHHHTHNASIAYEKTVNLYIHIKRNLAALSFWSASDKHAMLCNMRQTNENHTVPHVSIKTDNIYYTNIWGFWRSYWWQLLFKWSAEYYYCRQSKCVAPVMHITNFWKQLLPSFLAT